MRSGGAAARTAGDRAVRSTPSDGTWKTAGGVRDRRETSVPAAPSREQAATRRASAETRSEATWPASGRSGELGLRVRGGSERVDRREIGAGVDRSQVIDARVLLRQGQIRIHLIPGELQSGEPAPLLLGDPVEPAGSVPEPGDVGDRRGDGHDQDPA